MNGDYGYWSYDKHVMTGLPCPLMAQSVHLLKANPYPSTVRCDLYELQVVADDKQLISDFTTKESM
ncbi:MAG: hypothetical protein GY814_05780 [Gammaproteobacteria bacterium]|nr:hypothetical protein [Gammaproteobacteria bacterium]